MVMCLAAPPAWAGNALERLAVGCDAAVVADDVAAFKVTGWPVLQWLGLSVPEWSAAQVGTLRGQDGALNLMDSPTVIPPGHGVAVLKLPLAPSPVVAVDGLAGTECTSLRAALVGGAPENAAAWEAQGVCLVVVGECARHSCGPTGLKGPGRLKGDTRTAALEALPRTGLRVTSTGAFLRRWAGTTVARLWAGLGGVVAFLDASSPTWAVRWQTFHDKAVVDPGVLMPLPETLEVGRDAAVTVALRPSTKARAFLRGQPRAGRVVETWDSLPPEVGGVLEGSTLGLEWRGLDEDLRLTAAGDVFFQAFGGVHLGLANEEKARACAVASEESARKRGFTSDAGLWVKEGRLLKVAQVGARCSLWTGKTATREAPMTTVKVPALPFVPHVMVQGSGRRVAGVLGGVGLLHSEEDLQAAVAVREVVGPSIQRVEAFTVWLAPSDRGKSWVGQGTLDVGMARK
jgi:hypothetical protein